jgi:LmbE family N-acetylglucosaminyl deacetylase
MGWPDGHVAGAARQARLAALCHAGGAGLILATSPADHHADHRACFATASAVARRLRVPLVTYAVWSRLADPSRRRCRNSQVAAKNWAASAHRSQLSDYIPDSAEAFRLTTQDLQRFVHEPERYSRATTWR